MKKLTPREKRLFLFLGTVLCVIIWDLSCRHWSPDITVSTENYTIYSTATTAQTEEIGEIAEALHTAYMDFLYEIKAKPLPHGKLKINLFKNREEFRFCNRIRGWAEGFYREPFCYQYYSKNDPNPYHWMVHEATHQLNNEVAGLNLPKWLEEGIALYFGTSRISNNKLTRGEIDLNTYPIWWLSTLATSDILENNKKNKSIIPLKNIISGSGGPDMDENFNLYYLHWWSLAHFLFHYNNGMYKNGLAELIVTDANTDDFEKHIGKIDTIEKQWHDYVLTLKQNIK